MTTHWLAQTVAAPCLVKRHDRLAAARSSGFVRFLQLRRPPRLYSPLIFCSNGPEAP